MRGIRGEAFFGAALGGREAGLTICQNIGRAIPIRIIAIIPRRPTIRRTRLRRHTPQASSDCIPRTRRRRLEIFVKLCRRPRSSGISRRISQLHRSG